MQQVVSSTFPVDVTEEIAVTVKVDAVAGVEPGVPFLILAHGANNDLDFPLLSYLAAHLTAERVAGVARFNFPYVERGASSPDPRSVLESTFARVYEHVTARLAAPGAPIFIGGKSLGGRTAVELVSRHVEGSGLAAAGVIVLGYPLHAMGREDQLWLEPLRHMDIPSLFFAGTRDPLCSPDLLRPVLAGLVHPGQLHVVEGGDHSLHLPKSSGRRPEESYPDVAEQVADFIRRVAR